MLQSDVTARVEWLCREGDRHTLGGEMGEAAGCLLEAWTLLPEPREECPATAEVLRGLTRLLRARRGGLDALATRSSFHEVLQSLGLAAAE